MSDYGGFVPRALACVRVRHTVACQALPVRDLSLHLPMESHTQQQQ